MAIAQSSAPADEEGAPAAPVREAARERAQQKRGEAECRCHQAEGCLVGAERAGHEERRDPDDQSRGSEVGELGKGEGHEGRREQPIGLGCLHAASLVIARQAAHR